MSHGSYSKVPEVPGKIGPDTHLFKGDETVIKDWCRALAKYGYPLKSTDSKQPLIMLFLKAKNPIYLYKPVTEKMVSVFLKTKL